MKSVLIIFLATLTVLSVSAQTTNTSSDAEVRLQSVVKRAGVSVTNGQTQAGTHVIKTPAHLDEFIGTLLSVDKEKKTISIALGPPSVANRVKTTVLNLAPEAKFYKGEVAATLDDGFIGEAVRYRIRINQSDKERLLTVLRFLPDFKEKESK